MYPNQYPFQGSSGWKPEDGNKIVMLTGGPEPAPAKSFKLIAYAPGCQFATISVDDLASSDRQGQVACTRLDTIQFRGKADISAFAGKALQVRVFYGNELYRAFFREYGTIPPFSLGKADVAPDGSFTISLPDLAADPLSYEIKDDAYLYFDLVDGPNGRTVGLLATPSETWPNGGPLKVASSYPQVDFNVHWIGQRR